MKKYYIYSGAKKYVVDKEIYTAINHMSNRMYYMRHNADQCHATSKERAKCECDCTQCRGYANREETLDSIWMIPGSREPTAEDIVSCNEILEAMQRIDPDGRRIGQLYLARCTDVEISRILGISTSAFCRRKHKIKVHLLEYLAAGID